MKLGLLLLFESDKDFQSALENQLNLIKTFDKVVDTIWVTEHHYSPIRINSNPLMVLTHLASHTNKNFGIATLLLSLYDPIYIAEAISMLSHFSKRKIHIGTAKGGRSEVKSSHLNLTDNSARKRLITTLDSVRKLSKNETLKINDRFVSISPKFSYDIEYSIASQNQAAIMYAAMQNLPLMAGHKWCLDEIKQMISIYKKYHSKNETPKIILSRIFAITNNKEKTIRNIKDNIIKNRLLVSKFNKYHEPKDMNEKVFDESLIGSIEEIKKKLNYLKTIGVVHTILRPVKDEINQEKIEKCLGEYV